MDDIEQREQIALCLHDYEMGKMTFDELIDKMIDLNQKEHRMVNQ